VLALWLTRLGVRARVIDKTAEPGTTIFRDSTRASRKSTYALSPSFPHFEIIGFVEKERIDTRY
jgi:hypothetical protein